MAVIVAMVSLLLGGCVYLRLLRLKNQLADFDRYFEADTGDGLKLTFKEPVLLDEDMEGFFKWVPESRQQLNQSERWRFRWVKDQVAEESGRAPYALQVDFIFREHKLAKMIAPEAMFAAVMPKSLALGLIRSVGHAKVDEKTRSATSTVEAKDIKQADDQPLTRDGLLQLLGQPVQISGDASAPQWRYTFKTASPQQHFGRTPDSAVDVTFTLDAGSGAVRKMNGQSMGLHIGIDFGNANAKPVNANSDRGAANPTS